MIGVFAALPAEARCLTGLAHKTATCIRPAPGLILCIGGIGATAASRAAEQLMAGGATALLSWGCAAGLVPDLRAGDVLIPEAIIDNAGTHYRIDTAWRTRLETALAATRMRIHGGVLADSPSVLQSAADKQRLHQTSGALATDMESAAVAACAARQGYPFLCLRAIADTATMQVPPDLLMAVDDFGQPRLPALLLSIARHPGMIPELFRLGRAFGAAQRSLRLVARDAGETLGLSMSVRQS